MIASYGITIIRTNPDAVDFDMNRLINQIYTHIIKSTQKSPIDLSKRFLKLEFKSLNKIKVFKMDCQNVLPNYKKSKPHNQK